VLRALNALAARPLDGTTLAALAFSLGADVPYLLSTHALAVGSGRGEKLFPLGALPARKVLLALPPFGVASADAFGWYDAQKASRHSGTRATLPVGRKIEWRSVAALAANDLESVVAQHHPEISALRDALRGEGAIVAQMSGSGSVVFGVFESAAPQSAVTGAEIIETSTVEQVAEVGAG
jgi:4-diphosphocytidyl-2-C-methyl-D-erythritol kinase